MITPYTIAIPQADLDDLKVRLAQVRWTNEFAGVGTDYGVDLTSIKRLVTYWKQGYDWRSWEAKLNAYPQFTTSIDGATIHFLHVRSNVEDALPLILTHGWPTSVFDYLHLIDPLIDPQFSRRQENPSLPPDHPRTSRLWVLWTHYRAGLGSVPRRPRLG